MARSIDQILADKQRLEAELEQARSQQRDAVLKDVREKVKAFGITLSELKSVITMRRKRGTGPAAAKKTAAKKTAAKKTTK